MEIKTTISTGYELKELFAKYNRDDYEMCTYQGIVDYYDSAYGEEPQDFDVVAWCCDLSELIWSEVVDQYDAVKEAIDAYIKENELNASSSSIMIDEEVKDIIREVVSNNTLVIGEDDEHISFLAW